MDSYVEANFSTEQSAAGEDSRISGANVDESGSAGVEASPREGTQASVAVTLLKAQQKRLSKPAWLLKPQQFRRVYERGRRYDGRFMTVFVVANESAENRFGITVSKRVSTSAVKRNRAKRLLREAIRLNQESFARESFGNYDFVLNAKRRALDVKLVSVLEEWRTLAFRICGELVSLENASNQTSAGV